MRRSIWAVQESGTILTFCPPSRTPRFKVSFPIRGWVRRVTERKRSIKRIIWSMALTPRSGSPPWADFPFVEMRHPESSLEGPCEVEIIGLAENVGCGFGPSDRREPFLNGILHSPWTGCLVIDGASEHERRRERDLRFDHSLCRKDLCGDGCLHIHRTPAPEPVIVNLTFEGIVFPLLQIPCGTTSVCPLRRRTFFL